MSKDKKIIYILTFSMFTLLLFALFIPLNSKIVTVSILLPIVVLMMALIKKRNVLSIYKRQVLLITFLSSLLYLMIYFLFGIKFGFIENPYYLNNISIFQYIIPYFFIIISFEIIRYILLCQNNKLINVICFFTAVIIDVLLFNNLFNITSFNRFMDLIGLYLFPSITSNMLYHNIAKHYGSFPNIVFRLFTILMPFFVYFSPSTPDSLLSLFKLIVPLIMLFLISGLYDKKIKYATKRTHKFTYAIYGVFGVTMLSIIMLISCQFRFGLIVIASNSMSGEFSKGDAIIYEQYDDQLILEGDIIVFEKDDMTIVHRVVLIENINDKTRYFTKGDANEDIDVGFISDADILGIVGFKISYIGYPTLLLRDVFSR